MAIAAPSIIGRSGIAVTTGGSGQGRSAEVAVTVSYTSGEASVTAYTRCAIVQEGGTAEVSITVSYTSYFTSIAADAHCAVVENCRTADDEIPAHAKEACGDTSTRLEPGQ